jgi:hypothetical protein
VKQVFEAFRYPFARGNAFILILGVAVLSILTAVFSFIPIAGGIVGFILQNVFAGYYALYLREILQVSMEGRESLPAWPDWHHPDEFFDELLSVLAPFFVSFLPLLILRIVHDGLDVLGSPSFFFQSALPSGLVIGAGAYTVVSVVLFALGWLYLPMAILVWTYYGGWSIWNPVAVARTAWKVGPSYLGLTALTALLLTAAWSVTLIPAGMLTTFGQSILVFYALVVSMRLLGTFYLAHRERLGWETRERPEPV